MTSVETRILIALHERKVIHGTTNFASMLSVRKSLFLTYAMRLYRLGLIDIEMKPSGGRGIKTIYRDMGIIRAQR